MDELADVAAGATAEDDNAGAESEEESVGERDGLAEVLPAIRRCAGEDWGNEQLRGVAGWRVRLVEGLLGEVEPGLGGGGVAGEAIRQAGVFGELNVERGAMEDLAGASKTFGGGGAGNDGEQSVGGIGLEDGGAEECEPPVFEIESLGESGGDDGDSGVVAGWV